jgi:hypothetical protein
MKGGWVCRRTGRIRSNSLCEVDLVGRIATAEACGKRCLTDRHGEGVAIKEGIRPFQTVCSASEMLEVPAARGGRPAKWCTS